MPLPRRPTGGRRTRQMIIDKALAKVFGTKHERDIKALRPLVAQVGALEAELQDLNDDRLRERLAEIRSQVQGRLQDLPATVEERRVRLREVLDAHLVPVFAIVREAGK
ncbi:hypothetical protein FBQ97_22435, partial [Acidobacteria bacterium ACD]|nr:hypothetical protein [Acidobacteria bacterium ACD]